MLRPALALPLVLIALVASRAEAAECTWRVSGKLAVVDSYTAYPAVTRPLVGVKVQVAATLYSWGGFTAWDTVETDHTGRFQIVQTKSCSARRLRVWMKLDNADLQVVNPDAAEWTLLRDDPSGAFSRWTSATDLGTWTYAIGAPGVLGDHFAYRRAITWSLVDSLMRWLESHDPWLAFGRKVHVRYPANTPGGSSWAAIDTAYIHADERSDQWDIATVLHEVMHLWNYDHNNGVTNWLAAVLWDFDTHGEQEHPSIAFHEGFAEFAAYQMLTEMYPARFGQWHDEAYLDFDTLTEIERNDDAVAATLWLMQGSLVPTVDMLLCFRGNAALGWPRDLELGGTDDGLLMYLDRCNDLLASFTDAEYGTLLATVNP